MQTLIDLTVSTLLFFGFSFCVLCFVVGFFAFVNFFVQVDRANPKFIRDELRRGRKW